MPQTPSVRPGVSRLVLLPLVAFLLVVVPGCGAALQPTPIPTSTTTSPTTTPTSNPVPLATDTSIPATATMPPTDTATTVPTPGEQATASPSGTEGPLIGQWNQASLAGSKLASLALFQQGINPAVVAGAGGAWRGQYPYTQWQQATLQFTSEGRSTNVAMGDQNVMYLSNNTGCASGLPISTYRSQDGGQTWTQMSIQAIAFAAANTSTAYAITCMGASKTTDSGATWTDLPASNLTNYDPRSGATSPDGQTVFVNYASEGGEGKVQRSTDGGSSWADVTPQSEPGTGLGPLDNLFYVTGSVGRPQDGGLYMTGNAGLWFLPLETTNWKLTPKQAAGGDYQVTALWVDTVYTEQYNKPGPIIYEGRADTNGQTGLGVFRSTDLGATWQPVGTGLGNHIVTGLAIGANDVSANLARLEVLLAATDDGVWTLPLRPSPR